MIIYLMTMKFLILIIFMMISVGFFMLMERKLMGLVHFRLGPNKVFFKGLIQFLMDLIKLGFKNYFYLSLTMKGIYFFFPLFLLINMFFLWFLLPYFSIILNLNMSVMIFIIVMLMKLIIIIFLVYSFNSVYSDLSLIRMVSQMISYDIINILVLLIYIYLFKSFSLFCFLEVEIMGILMSLIVFLFWFISVLVELIRLPFDFYEGESELVSGFNIELGFSYFLILVLVEYMEMIYLMMVTLLIFLFSYFFLFYYYFFLLMMVILLIWLRVFFVRYRYDKMLMMFWKLFFPVLMFNFIFIYFVFLV